MTSTGMASGLQRRLLLLLLVPLAVLSFGSAWFDYRLADSAAVQRDRQLLLLLPLLADSVAAPGLGNEPPVVLMAPAVQEFLRPRGGPTAYAITASNGRLLHGVPWLAGFQPDTREPEFHSVEQAGVTYRLAVQRVNTVAGDLVLVLADGSDPRLGWRRLVLWRVVVPNLTLMLIVGLAVGWAVRRALRPLTTLAEAVGRRSPRDLDPIDEESSPEEVRPLVHSLNRLFGRVNAQADSQRRFVADAAHQLRTPLAGLQAQVEAWTQALSPLPGTKHPQDSLVLSADQLYKLRDATRRTSQLANQLLALSRVDARELEAKPMQPVDLKELCEEVLQTQLDAAAARSIDLGLEVLPCRVLGHAWLLRELLGNLVDNALRYTSEGGTVTLRCGFDPVDSAAAFVEVEDDGPGIPPAEHEKVVERFYRVPGTAGEGSGLGLAIASEIARLHGSELSLLSGAGERGLRARVVLRVAQPAEPGTLA